MIIDLNPMFDEIFVDLIEKNFHPSVLDEYIEKYPQFETKIAAFINGCTKTIMYFTNPNKNDLKIVGI